MDLTGFQETGYLMLGSVMDSKTILELREILAGLPRRPEDKGTLFFNQKRGEFKALGDFASHGPQVGVMKQLIGPNLRCWYDQFVVKPPHEKTATFPWHQDNGYKCPYPDNNVTVWIALDEVNEDNGCVWVFPGSHKKGLVPHQSKSKESWYVEAEVQGNGVPTILKAGEAVAFTGYTLHRSLGNKTDKPRRAFFLEYCDADACFDDGTPINQAPADSLFIRGLSPVITGVSQYD